MAPRVVNSPRDPAHSQLPAKEQTVDTTSIRETTPEVLLEKPLKCAGCGQSFLKEQHITVHEGRHDNLHFFHGDLVCRPCARANGVDF
jgi:hypothetical protein